MAVEKEETLSARLDEIEAAWGMGVIEGEAREPNEGELARAGADLLAAILEAPDCPEGSGLAAGIERMAQRLQTTPDHIKQALAGDEGEAVAWEVLIEVLELAADPGWLTQPEGRGGRPLSAAEAGLDRHDRAEGSVIHTDGRDGKGLAKHWWSRK